MSESISRVRKPQAAELRQPRGLFRPKATMKIRKPILVMIVVIFLAGLIFIGYQYLSHPTLRRLARNRDLQIGVSVAGGYLNDPEYSRTLRREFSIITP